MKKFLTFVLVLAMVLSVSSVALAAWTGTGNGTEATPYIVNDETSLNAALAESGTFIRFGSSFEVSNKITIKRSVTIDGNGETLTYTGTDRAIDIHNDAGNAAVTIQNLTVSCTASYCERGISYNATGQLTLDNVTVGGTNVTYALNIPGKAIGCEVTINGGSYTGCIALNVWGKNSTINVNNATLTSVDNSNVEGYGVVKLNNDSDTSAEDTVITITGGSIVRTGTYKDDSCATTNATSTGKINISKTTDVDGEQRRIVAVVKYSNGTSYGFTSIEAAVQHAEEPNSNTTIDLLTDDVDISNIQTDKVLTIVGTDGTRYSTSNGTVGIEQNGVKVSPIKLDFGTKEAGYSGVAAQTVTIEGAANKPTVTVNSADYIIGEVKEDNGNYTFTVQPKDGLSAGNHDASITVSNVTTLVNGTPFDTKPIEVKFTVNTKTSSGSGISVKYNGGNSFSTSNPAVPTGVEIDGVPVTFNGTGSNFTVGCISSDAKWVTVRWNSTTVTTNFTPDGLVECTTVAIPKTGDMPFWAAIAEFLGF